MYYDHDCTSNDTSHNYIELHDPYSHYEHDHVSKDTSHDYIKACTMSMTVHPRIQVITT